MSLQDKLAELRVKNNMNDRYLKDAIASHAHIANGIIAEIDAIEKQIADAEVTYSIGDRFKSDNESAANNKRMLVRFPGGDIGLIGLHDGTLWSSTGKCINDRLITQAEFDNAAGFNGYHRCWDNRKQQKVSE